MPKGYKVVALPGDGVGPEVLAEGIKVLKAVEGVTPGLKLDFVQCEAGAGLYKRTGEAFPSSVFDLCKKADAIYKAPMGLFDVRYIDGSEVGPDVTLGLRFGLDLYANVRPAKLYPGVSSLVRGKSFGDIDYVIVRENTEGLYAARGGGSILRDELAVDSIVITRKGTKRVVKFAFELAKKREGAPLDGEKRVTCVDKSNVLKSYAFFRKVYDEVANEYPNVNRDYAYVDAMTQWMLRKPEWYDVVVTENMFGDIIADLAASTAGGMGLAPSANIGNERAMFEPVHGSAPRHAGKNEINPIATILSGRMMLEWLADKHNDDAARIAAEKMEKAVAALLAEGKVRTYDLGGTSKTSEVGDAIVNKIK